MDFDFIMTQKANADLDDIISYLAVELASPQAADHFLRRFQSAVDEARRFPQSGAPVSNEFLPESNIRKKYIDNYIIYYLPDFAKRHIVVLRILYGRRSLDEILRQLDEIP